MGAKASKAAGQQLEAAQARFPAEEVSGAVERAGMGETKKSFDTIKSFAWTLGGTGEVKICRVQDVSLNKSPAAHLEVEECTGLLKSDNLAKGDVHVKKANIVYSHDTCTSKVKIDECNCLIILKGGVRTEYTVGKGEVIAIDPGNITLNKGAEVQLKAFDSKSEALLEGQEAADELKRGGATVNDI